MALVGQLPACGAENCFTILRVMLSNTDRRELRQGDTVVAV